MEQLSLTGVPVPAPPASGSGSSRDGKGRFRKDPGPIPSSAEIATVTKGEFLSPLTILEFPNFSQIIRYRAQGQGVRFYDTMLGSDSDLSGLFNDLFDDVLHYPYVVSPASSKPEHLEHARFLKFAFESIPNRQNVLRHFVDAYARGFAIFEKMYDVVPRGEWTGAVIFSNLLDKPQRWFSFDPERRLRFRNINNAYPGELVDQGKFAVVTFGTNSNPWGAPLLDLCYWPWYLKHHALKNQAVFFEKWASPTAVVEYDAVRGGLHEGQQNLQNRNKALVVAQSIQNDQALAVPKGMAFSLLESMRNGSISFESYIKQLTEMESRVITGQLLTSMGASGGSHALGKVHEKRAANKSEMLAFFVSTQVTRLLGRELIDRNYGPQDAYPIFRIIAKDPVSRQADVQLEKGLMENGHKLSRSWADEAMMVVPPIDAADELQFPAGLTLSRDLPVNPTLAAPIAALAAALAGAHRDLHASAMIAAAATKTSLEGIGRAAVATARPAIHRAVKALGKAARGKKTASAVKRTAIYKGLRKADASGLGDALDQMLVRPTKTPHATLAQGAQGATADEPAPPNISTAAKLALALQMIAIAERVADAAVDAPPDMAGDAFADSLTDPNGVALDQVFGNLFEAVHGTNISSVATGELRRKLDDPKFRQQYPYVMIVVTNPNARLSHRMMDGYILSADEARWSPFLPPFDFGCDCQAVPITAEQALAHGLTGSAPAGTLEDFLKAKGAIQTPMGEWATPSGDRFQPGTARGFQPAMRGTDTYVQLSALRTKVEEIRREDPEAWAQLQLWLIWLFAGVNVLTEDPPPDQTDQAAA